MRYPISKEDEQRIEHTFTYHKPIADQQERYQELRVKAKQLAYVILSNTPRSREQSIALTKLEEVIFIANAAIARNEKE